MNVHADICICPGDGSDPDCNAPAAANREARAEGYAAGLAAAREAVASDDVVRATHVDVDWVHLSAVLAAIAAIEVPS